MRARILNLALTYLQHGSEQIYSIGSKRWRQRVSVTKPIASEKQSSAEKRFDEISADVQTFRDLLPKVTVCQPSGINANNTLSMTIAIHMGKRISMSCSARNYTHAEWHNHLIYAVLKHYPKSSDASMTYGASDSSF